MVDALPHFMTGGTLKPLTFELTFLVVLLVILFAATLVLFNMRSQNE